MKLSIFMPCRFPGTSSNIPRKIRAKQICRKNQSVNAGVCAPGVEEEVKMKILISE